MPKPFHANSVLIFCLFADAALSVRPATLDDPVEVEQETQPEKSQYQFTEAQFLDDDHEYVFELNACAFYNLGRVWEEFAIYALPSCNGEAAASLRWVPWISN